MYFVVRVYFILFTNRSKLLSSKSSYPVLFYKRSKYDPYFIISKCIVLYRTFYYEYDYNCNRSYTLGGFSGETLVYGSFSRQHIIYLLKPARFSWPLLTILKYGTRSRSSFVLVLLSSVLLIKPLSTQCQR